MGLMDRFRASRQDSDGSTDDTGTPPPVDETARSAQLIELDDALRTLAREMAGDGERMRNPGWAGKVADYRTVAADAAALERDGFDRAALTDLASQVVPLYREGTSVPPEYEPYVAQHERAMAAVDALRAVPSSEQTPEVPGPSA
jgi:hypothetical protein